MSMLRKLSISSFRLPLRLTRMSQSQSQFTTAAAARPTQPSIGARGQTALDKWLATAVDSGDVPALFVGVATKDDILYYNCRGERVLGDPEKGAVDEDTIIRLWSMTKLVTCIAALQLRERGLVDLDDAELCERVLPELCAMPILERYDGDEPVYSPRTEAITLRRLMTHTVGQSYGDAAQIRWEKENLPISWRHANAGVESFATPLMCQPGSRFAYGLAIDWVGILVSRVAGQSLEEFFAENIWTPLGLKSFTFLPTEAVRAKLMQCCSRTREGKLIHIGQSEKYGKDPLPHEIIVQSGGGGLYGTMKEYLVFLQNVLRCRDAPGIISPATFRELFSDSLPPADGSHNCQKTLGSFLRMRGYPEKQYTSGAKIGYSPGLCLNLAASENGRKAGSAFWFGAARSEYWMDPATGVILMNDHEKLFQPVYTSYERAVYDVLEGDDRGKL